MKRITVLLSLAALLMVPGTAGAGPAGRWRERAGVHREWRPAAYARQRALAEVRRARSFGKSGSRWLGYERRVVIHAIQREYRVALRTAQRASRAALRRFRS